MKFGQLIFRKIIKIVTTRCQILRLKYTQIDFGRSSTQTPLKGSLQRSPRSLSWNTLREGKGCREGKGKKSRGRKEKRGGEKKGRKRRESKGVQGTPVCIFKFSLE